MEKIKLCDDCKKKCDQRIKGGICSIKKETGELCKSLGTRDPMLVAMEMAKIIDSEKSRYDKAVVSEDVGGTEESVFIDERGNTKTVTKTKQLDSKISTLALNLLKGGKIIHEIVNPQKNPLFQQNNQYNVTLSSADEINKLPKAERADAIKFIDNKLDDERKDN